MSSALDEISEVNTQLLLQVVLPVLYELSSIMIILYHFSVIKQLVGQLHGINNVRKQGLANYSVNSVRKQGLANYTVSTASENKD
ncbi:hypothetical protein CHS0354_007968 [Potamilus streckersoni]|uniref:Uncharacterized protein n=1 Tax=Potamilus streckersoni TaxID=2493646 RepID=A0AAE0SC90_9BIVA|nr:hypothetical protein CHS0354_007968 [Potamilus streckersoni]